MANNKQTTLLGRLDDFLSQLHAEKVAAEMGDKDTTHPSKNVDDQTQDVTEGSRSAENSADVKKNVPGDNVESTSGNEENEPAINAMGTKKAPTGEDPASEDAYKAYKDDPGTSSKMTADDGEKYSSVNDLSKVANEILATIAVMAKEAAKTSDPKRYKPVEKTAEVSEFVKAGYVAAAALCENLAVAQRAVIEKEAAEQTAALENIIKQAELDATNLIGFIKAASEDEGDEYEESEGGEPKENKSEGGEGGGEAPPAPAETAGLDPAAAGGDPVDPAAAGGDPAASAGGDIAPEELEVILQSLAESGIDPEVLASIPPEALEAAIAEATADVGGEGGDPAAAGGGEVDLSALLG